MKNIRPIAILSLVALFFIAGLIYVLSNKPSADSAMKTSHYKTQDQGDLRFLDLSEEQVTAKDTSAILAELAALAKDKIDNAQVKSQGLQTENRDMVFYPRDLKGNIVNSSTMFSGRVIRNIEDNFAFDSSVTGELKGFFVKHYPNVEKYQGKRLSSDPIKVSFLKDDPGRSYYIGGMANQIVMRAIDEGTCVHELSHAFRQFAGIPSLYEEGIAMTVTRLVMGSGLAHQSQYYEDKANYFRTYFEYYMPWDYEDAYIIGEGIVSKFFIEDKLFIANFNKRLKETPKSILTKTDLVQLVGDVLPTIENTKTNSWFLSKPFLYSTDQDRSNELYADYEASQFYISSALPRESVLIKIYDSRDVFIGSSSIRFSEPGIQSFGLENISYSIARGWTRNRFRNYYGLIKTVISDRSEPADQRPQYFYKDKEGETTLYESDIAGYVDFDADTVKIRKVNSAKGASGRIANKAYALKDSSIAGSGKYQIDYYSRERKVSSRYVTKEANTPYFAPKTTKSQDCASPSPIIHGLTRNINLQFSQLNYCALSFVINNIAQGYKWSRSGSFNLSSMPLTPSTSHKVTILGNTGNKENYIETSKNITTYTTDFQVVGEATTGSVLGEDIKREYTFSNRLSTVLPEIRMFLTSSGINTRGGAGEEQEISIETVAKDKKLIIKPLSPLTSGSNYCVFGIGELKDFIGNPLIFEASRNYCFKAE